MNKKYKNTQLLAILTPIIFSLIVLVSNFFEYNNLSNIQTKWDDHFYNHQSMQNSLKKINDHLGYDGVIHHFKNYVLRKDPSYRDSFLLEYKAFNESYNKLYNKLNDNERVLIEPAAEVVDSYYSNLEIVDREIEKKSSIETIDNLVRINDEAAANALRDLDKVIQEKARITSLELNSLISRSIQLNIFLVLFIILTISFLTYQVLKVFKGMVDEAKKYAEAKSRFLGNMSHEIRTPLNGIVGFIELIEQSDLKGSAIEYLNYIKSSSNLLIGVVNNVLDFSKIETGEMKLESENIKLEDFVLLTVDQFLPITRERKIELNYNFDSNLPTYIYGDELRISQVLTNLISNAIKFTSEGVIQVNVRQVNHKNNQPFLQFEVRDTGTGMSAEVFERVFVPFEQGNNTSTRKYSGLGLGLSIVQDLVSLMDGSIDVNSEEGQGTSISFSIPLVEGREDANVIDINKDIEVKPDTKVMIVEDNKVNQKVAHIMLTRLGYSNIRIAETGVEAVVKNDIHNFDLIFMDIQMPKMNGIDATKEIRRIAEMKSLEQPLIIGLSASAFQGDKMKALDHGMNDFIEKPVTLNKLKKSLLSFSQRTLKNDAL